MAKNIKEKKLVIPGKRMKRPEIENYLDYRKYLDDFFKMHRGNRLITKRSISKELGIAGTGYMNDIIRGTKNLSKNTVKSIMKALRMSNQDKEYFLNMHAYTIATSQTQMEDALKNLLKQKKKPKDLIGNEYYQIYKNWYTEIIFHLLDILDFKDSHDEIARALSHKVNIHEVHKAITLLKRLGIVKRKNGFLKPVRNIMDTGVGLPKSILIRKFQKALLGSAMKAIDIYPKEIRDISTLTIGINDEMIPEIKKLIKETREKVIDMVKADTRKANSVYSLGIALFPQVEAGYAGKRRRRNPNRTAVSKSEL